MRYRFFKVQTTVAICFVLFFLGIAAADVRGNLESLRNKCLFFAIGHSPNDPNYTTIRHGLYAQAPSSPPGEIDLAASGFSLAALPLAVKNNLITREQGYQIAVSAGARIREMVWNSETAVTSQEIDKFGYKGMLYHYYTWSDSDVSFKRTNNVEVSSIDTTLLMLGFLASAQYFQGQVMTDFEATFQMINWREWLDSNNSQFRMSYTPENGFSGYWNAYSQETMLISIFAAMSDPSLDVVTIWNAWRTSLPGNGQWGQIFILDNG